METTPFISVIIPAFNSEKTIIKSLVSVLNQNFKNYEILVMDGLSTDMTESIVNGMHHKHLNVHWYSEKDEGIYDAINKGIKKSKGEWVYVLGSDDELADPGVFNSVHSVLSKSNSDFVYGNVRVVGNAGWAKDGEIYSGEFNLEKLLKSNICQQAVFYRKSVFEKVGYFNPKYKICADWEMAFRIYASSSFFYIPDIICNFNGGGTSISRKDDAFSRDLIKNLIRSFDLALIRKEFIPLRFRIIEFGNLARSELRFKLWWKCRKIYHGLERLSDI